MKKIFIFLIAIFICGFCFGNEVQYEWEKDSEAIIYIVRDDDLLELRTISKNKEILETNIIFFGDEQKLLSTIEIFINSYKKNKTTFNELVQKMYNEKKLTIISEPELRIENNKLIRLTTYVAVKQK